LKTRCKAIQRALAAYNSAAKAIDRPVLDWSSISKYGSIAEFELLRECRDDIRALPWADSTNRQVAIYQLKLERADEEHRRLNVEIQRLVTSMRDEETDISLHIKALNMQAPWLAAELKDKLARHVQINNIHHARIQEIYSIRSYSGARGPGIRVGQMAGDVDTSDLQTCGTGSDDGGSGDSGDEGIYPPDEDDFIGDQLDGLATYLEKLSLET